MEINKITRKLIATVLALILSVVMVVTISYAWMTLSNNPVTEGIQITIGGGNTILIAADMTQTVDGTVYHYPAHFSDSLHFGQYEQYAYLNDLSSLTPVSTADGIHWFLPEYYDIFDEAVINGDAVVGQIKPIADFSMDTYLEHANLTQAEGVQAAGGHYAYLDFWVVSPGTEYQLRISRGDENGGSFLVELMEPQAADEDGDGVAESYVLQATSGKIAASARVGFLVNPDQIMDDTMLYYQESYGYSDAYTKLRGSYQEPDSGSMWYSSEYRFTIYEPNGNLHPAGEQDTYVPTTPVWWDGEHAVLADIGEKLTVQLANAWKTGDNEDGIVMEDIFQTALLGKQDLDSVAAVKKAFYQDYLQGQVMPYVKKGAFVKNTASLYGYAGDGLVSSAELANLNTAGATDDTYIVTLEKNVPQRIRMFIWLEGQDVDCTDTAGVTDLALSIELAGSNS